MFKWAQRIARFLIVLVTLNFLVFSFLIAWFAFGFHDADQYKTPEVAFWMEHQWVTKNHGDYATLSNQLSTLPPTSLYFHVGPIQADGRLADDLSLQPALLNQLPSTNYAWIGQIRSKIDLDNATVRKQIIDSSAWLLTQGFDGIHVNVEPVYHNDQGFQLLIEEMDAQLPETLISISMDEWQPHFLTRVAGRLLNAVSVSYWTGDQVTSLVPHVDEFVVMTYDTNFHDPKLFSWWVEHQTVALSRLMDDDTRLLIGLPVYEEGASIDPLTENLSTGLVGYTRGITNRRAKPDAIDGIAIYPYWEMDTTEWQILNNYLNETPLQ